MDSPLVSIVIPVYNNLFFTRQCLQALRLTTPVAHELLIVDNASTDGTAAFLREQEGLVLIENPENLGFAKACNQGARAAKGKYLVFLNNDTVPQPRWLESMLDLACTSDVGLVGSRLLFPDGTIQHAGLAFPEDLFPNYLYFRFPATFIEAMQDRELQAVSGACVLLRRALFEELGGFDEGYLNSWEDIDLCLKVRARGLKVMYCGRSTLYHYESMSDGRFKNDAPNSRRFFTRWKESVREDLSRFTEAPSSEIAGAILASRWESKTPGNEPLDEHYEQILSASPAGREILDHFLRQQRILQKQSEAMREQLEKLHRLLPIAWLRRLKRKIRSLGGLSS